MKLTPTVVLALALSSQSGAQTIGNVRPVQTPTPLPSLIGPADPADMLSMHLRTLSVAPRSLSALLGAGQSALAIGDPNAALGFFARAEQVDERSGKAKAGLASALVMLERPDDALPLFARAVALGVPESEVARDRGLAYDLRGDPRLAQRDYLLVLKRGPDDETTRRYALSLGISGDRVEAMKALDPLLRKQDQGAWRARAFILAMTGDVPGANGIARQVMPANLAATMAPFLTRLPQLNAADKAHAVAFGTMPSAGTNMASVEIGDPFHAVGPGTPARTTDASDGLIPSGTPLGTRSQAVQVARAAPPARQTRGRSKREVLSMAAPMATAATPSAVVAPAPNMRSLPAPMFSTPVSQPTTTAPVSSVARVAPTDMSRLPSATVAARPVTITPVPSPAFETPPRTVAVTRVEPWAQQETRTGTRPIAEALPMSQPQPAFETKPAFETQPKPAAQPVVTAARPASPPVVIGPPAEVAIVRPTPALPSVVAPARALKPGPAPTVPMSRLASILAGLTPEMESPSAALPTAAQAKAARRSAQRKAAEAAAVAADLKAEKAAQAAEAAEQRRNPARLWVQVATGSNERGLPATWARIRDDNETALKGRSAWSVPFKATNRLLVGPMKSPAEARALVNALAKGGSSANTFSSEAGQEVTRVGGK
jgi:Flp pilus assembly protein TadD